MTPAHLPELKDTDDSHGGDILEKFVWPASPPQSPTASDDDSLPENVKECASSDSSPEEYPMTPLTPRAEQFFNTSSPKDGQNPTERWVRYQNTGRVK